MKESEKVIERKLVELTKANGGMCIKLLSFHIVGLPDRLCIFPHSKIAFVELKTTGEKPRPIQLYIQEKIRKMGFVVVTIDSINKVHEFIDATINEHVKYK